MTDSELFDDWYDSQGYSTNRKSHTRSVARKAYNQAIRKCVLICEARGIKGGYTAHMTEAKRIAKELSKEYSQ